MKNKSMKNKPGTWITVLSLLLCGVSAVLVWQNRQMGIVCTVTVATVLLAYAFVSARSRSESLKHLESIGSALSLTSKTALVNHPMPMAIISPSDGLSWYNKPFADATGTVAEFGIDADEAFPGLSVRKRSADEFKNGFDYRLGDRIFLVYGSVFKASGQALTALYWIEQTDYRSALDTISDIKPVVAIISIDSYEDISQAATESEKAGTLAEIDKKLTAWAGDTGGFFKNVERDRYYFIFESRYIEGFVQSKFDILDSVREILLPNRIPVSISIGVGVEGESYNENEERAKQALDMALGRGGDQAVIKSKNNFEFFGGRSKGVEKRTKVKSRVIAGSFAELLDGCDNVLVMGHKFADFDSVGSCVGVARMAMVHGKPVNIVMNRNTGLAETVVEKLDVLPEYRGVFVDPITGLDLVGTKTLLVICDCHSIEYVESPDIYRNVMTVVLFDHHRRMADYIDKTALTYHEPYASSASEIVAELLQYIDGRGTIMKEEAEALLAGIVLDTKNFYFKTGFRTFEAAAYLKKSGADLIEVKKLFQSDYESYIKRTEFITHAQFYRDEITISRWEGGELENAKVIMSQAADELLGIEGCEASFVIHTYGKQVHISGRSLGGINVQLIMEKLGGGGHLTTAGAQLEGTADEVTEILKAAIDEYLAENERLPEAKKTRRVREQREAGGQDI